MSTTPWSVGLKPFGVHEHNTECKILEFIARVGVTARGGDPGRVRGVGGPAPKQFGGSPGALMSTTPRSVGPNRTAYTTTTPNARNWIVSVRRCNRLRVVITDVGYLNGGCYRQCFRTIVRLPWWPPNSRMTLGLSGRLHDASSRCALRGATCN